MTSRELRRAVARQGQPKPTETEKRRQSHPMTYLFSLIILVIIVVTFIGLPYYQSVSRQASLIFGSYGGQDIRYISGNYFAQQKDLLSQKLQNSSQKLSPQAESYQVWRGAFELTAVHLAILQAAKQSGLRVTTHQVDTALAQYGPYVVNGKFSIAAYNQTSTQQRAQTRALFQQELIDQQYRTDVINGEKYSDQAVSFLQGMASPERSFRYVSYDLTNYPTSEVIKYGKANSRLFRTIRLSRITLKNAHDADVIWQKLQQDPNLFQEFAKNQSIDAYSAKGGEMGTLTYAALIPDFESQAELDRVFALKAGQMSGVIHESFGWTIYRVDQAAKAPDFTNPQTVKDVQSYLETYDLGTIQNYFTNVANKFRTAAESDGFTTAAGIDGLTVHETNWFPINYGNAFFFPQAQDTKNGPALSSVGYQPSFLQEAFSLKIGSISKPMVLNNRIVVLNPLGERQAPAQFEKVLSSYYPLIAQQFLQTDLTDQILSSPQLKDNFQQVFTRYFTSSTPQPAP